MLSLVICSCFCGCQALKPFNQTMQTRVAAARQWSGNGIAAIKRGAVSEARTCFAKASSQLPDDHRIVANVARTHFQQGQTRQAIEVMRRAIDIRDDDPELHAELGEYYLADGQLEAALHEVDRCLEKNHRIASAWLLKGKTRAANGEFKAALGDYQRALGIDGSREDIQLQIVKTYQHLGEPLRALSAVEQLLEKYPTERQPESAILAKSSALFQLNQHSPAIEVLEVASNRADVSSDVFVALAQTQILAGSPARALQTLTSAQQRFPNRPQISQLANQLRSDEKLRIASLD
jgi:tetratricopeptide (TPR) repeat protein